jgi:uncharacterized circularly permuted ATP-grasp superfamily protein/uncharacterized alpha-E superfamily protein
MKTDMREADTRPVTPPYQPLDGHWDEALTEQGAPRRDWRKLTVSLARMGPQQFDRRWRTGQQLIQANGVTYNVYGDPQGKERPWPLDPIPFVIGEQEWASIERAIVQRATLLNAMLADVYGPQRLVKGRHIPAALLYANPHFLRPCCGIEPPGGAFLHSYAADLGRSPDGKWWVIADRTQAPSGIGYALENRLVSARTLPNVFMQYEVRPLTRFLQVTRDALLALAPGQRSTPRVVLLTPGPHNETYFEHSFLARHWGFPLVEGADLTVRENRVYLKTLGGLEPVHLILRRQDDSFCDPLELRGDSLLGVPGLLQAVRSGTVAVANALGSGLMETPAHMAFLPGLCRELLEEELLLPSVATWWCGQEEPRRYVLDHLDQFVIKPAFPRFGQHPQFPALLSQAERALLARRIEARPDHFLAQEQVALSTAPVWSDGGIVPRHLVLRVFAAWDGQSYTVLPGGLTRVATNTSSLIVTMQLGGGSKDTWVVGGSEEGAAPVVRPSRLQVDVSRSMGDLPSRLADNLFWLGRYAERVETILRVVRSLLPALSGEEDFGQTASLETGIQLMVGFRYLPAEILQNSIGEQRRQMERVLSAMVYDQSRMSGLGWNLNQVRRVAWQLKERFSSDTWRVLQQLEMEFSHVAPVNPDQRYLAEMNLLDRAISTLSAFSGLLMENTTRGPGWRFVEIGRRMERAIQMVELLRHGMAEITGDIDPYLAVLLQIADSSITYRARYLTTVRADLVLDLLLADEANPRAVAFQAAALDDHVKMLPGRETVGRHPLEQRMVWKALTSVRLASMERLTTCDAEGRMPELIALLDSLKGDLLDLSETLTATYLSHVTPSRLVASS